MSLLASENTKITNKISAENVEVFYGESRAIHGVSMNIPKHRVTALIGPSGCGKSTFLRSLNRMNDIFPNVRVKGKILLDGKDIYAAGTDVIDVRRRVGMVFQKSN